MNTTTTMSWFHRIAREGTVAVIASVTMLAFSSVSATAFAGGPTGQGGDGHGGSPTGTVAGGTYVPTTPGGKSADGGYTSPEDHFLNFMGRVGGWLGGRDLGGNGTYVPMSGGERLTSGVLGGLGLVGGGLLMAGIVTGVVTAAPVLLGIAAVGGIIFGAHFLMKSFFGKKIDNRYQPQQPPANHNPLPGTISGPPAPGAPGSSIPGGNPNVPPYGAPQGPGSPTPTGNNGSGQPPTTGSTGSTPPSGVTLGGTGGGHGHMAPHGPFGLHVADIGVGGSGNNISRNSSTSGAAQPIPAGVSGGPNEGFHH